MFDAYIFNVKFKKNFFNLLATRENLPLYKNFTGFFVQKPHIFKHNLLGGYKYVFKNTRKSEAYK